MRHGALDHGKVLFIDAPLDQQARTVDTSLPVRTDSARQPSSRGLLQIRICENDDRGFSAELQATGLECRRSLSQHFLCSGAAADELNLVDAGMLHHRFAGSGATGDDIDHTWRKSGFLKQLPET